MRPGQRHARPALIAALALACPAIAQTGVQTRAPADRQHLLDLAETLGEAHALRQVCQPDDSMWRARMQRLIEVEAPDDTLEAALSERFNAGFSTARGAHSRCDATSRAAETRVAARGRTLADQLSRTP